MITAMANFGTRKKGPGSTPQRAKRIPVQTRLTSQQHEKARLVAEALGISMSALLAELIDRVEVDETWHPGWTSLYADEAATESAQLSLSA
jgi:hypothetical protein